MPSTVSYCRLVAIFIAATISINTGNCAVNASKTQAHEPQKNYAQQPEVMRFGLELAQRQHLDPAWVQNILSQARYLPTAQRLMQPSNAPASKNWHTYRSRLIDPVRIAAGVAFWQENRSTLEQAQKIYGVPIAVIVGILGIETLYGRNMGHFRVLDALVTLGFDFPVQHPRARERSEFFKGEIEQFLLLHQRLGTDPLSSRGSYAGAIGIAQFMPSSWNKYALDFDHDGVIDLWGSSADAIGSVAHYLQAFNWQRDMPTYYPVTLDNTRLDKEALLAPDILPTFSPAALLAKGAIISGAALEHTGPLALIELKNGEDEPSYVVGTENFYVITRYNWSSYYAMAVIELGQAVAKAVRALEP